MPDGDIPRRSMLSVSEAEAIIQSHARQTPAEIRTLAEASDAVLREDILADRDFPPFDRAAMDGIAFSFTAFGGGRRQFRILGTQAAGRPRLQLSDPNGCLEVMTGAVTPLGCDCIVPVEMIERTGGEIATIIAQARVERLQNIHLRGSDYPAGSRLIASGRRLRAPEIAVCATVGKSEVAVGKAPKIAIVATGDELVEITCVPKAYQIRTSNIFAIRAALRSFGYTDIQTFHATDDEEVIRRRFAELLENTDLLIINGGVSAGKFDLVPGVLDSLGVKVRFHKVKQRPGMPLWFGVGPAEQVVFALPGNPVASLLSTYRYIIPFLDTCSGAAGPGREYAELAENYSYGAPFTLFLPVKVKHGTTGKLLAVPCPVHGSGDLAGLTQSDGFIELPAEPSVYRRGSPWPLYRWTF